MRLTQEIRDNLRSAGFRLRRGMSLLNGWLVVHGEVGDLPVREGDRVEVLTRNRCRDVLTWRKGGWQAGDGSYPFGAVPDPRDEATNYLLMAELLWRSSGEKASQAPPDFVAQQGLESRHAARLTPDELRMVVGRVAEEIEWEGRVEPESETYEQEVDPDVINAVLLGTLGLFHTGPGEG